MTFDGMAKVCAEAAGISDPQIVHYDPKSVEVPTGRGGAFFDGITSTRPCFLIFLHGVVLVQMVRSRPLELSSIGIQRGV